VVRLYFVLFRGSFLKPRKAGTTNLHEITRNWRIGSKLTGRSESSEGFPFEKPLLVFENVYANKA